MPRVDLELSVNIERTAKVAQIEGIFDVPEAKRRTVDFHFDVPLEENEWQIGLIVGPSGAGKSTVARHLFPESMVGEYDWEEKKSLVDSFGKMAIRDITDALSSVGFNAPTSWTKPYHVLSNGEKFRATLARAITDERNLIVIDEFTSVIDRTVAQIGSHAVAKAVRRRPEKRFVAVSCHDDIVEWLQPDWILEPHLGRFRWRSVQRRPSIQLDVFRANYQAWQWFAPYHYLTANLSKSARIFVGTLAGRPVVLTGVIYFPHPKVRDIWRESRTVVMPDFQGLAIGLKFPTLIASIGRAMGYRMRASAAHPALLAPRAKSPDWKLVNPPRLQPKPGKNAVLAKSMATRRRIATFQYCGEPFADLGLAKKLWG